MNCPKCHAANRPTEAICEGCGLVFARYDAGAQARADAARRARDRAERQDASRLRRFALVAAGTALAAILLGVWWNGRPTPQDFAAPHGNTHRGVAHEYAGEGADLVLVNAEGPVQVIGRIHRGGRFEFALPDDLALPRVPREATLPPDAKFRNEQERAVIERRMAALAASYEGPAAAVRRLHAGDGWQTLEVQPAALNVGRYAIAYEGPGGSGMLVASNSDLAGIALPGDHVLAFVYADRAGTVRGAAVATNALGMTVPNDWDLKLQPGWNLVTSEQTGNLARIAYRAGDVPDDLAWYAIDPRTRTVSIPRLGGLPAR